MAVVELGAGAVFVNGKRVASFPAGGSGPIPEVVNALREARADAAIINAAADVEARLVVRALDSVKAAGYEKVSLGGGPEPAQIPPPRVGK